VHERVDAPLALTAALDRQSWNIAIADYTMPTFPGAAAFDLLRQRDADRPFIFVSGTSREDAAARLDLILQYRVETRRMWISQTVREAGVNTPTLRYYERRAAQAAAARMPVC
jgi:CheY-like chemotaxis protein